MSRTSNSDRVILKSAFICLNMLQFTNLNPHQGDKSMRRRTLTDLANNPDLISGIYNYCDRWCERCPLTSRCLVYATEKEDDDSAQTHDLTNEAFWRKLGSIFQETREMIVEWALSLIHIS